jgi:alpha-D-xyloside xylohydrolase
MYGPEVEEIARRYLKLRYRLLPYIYSQAVKSAQNGLPLVRPMVLEFQSDPTTHCLDLQYMFGESFLVAPVVNRDGRCQVYLPQGEWLDYWTKEVAIGPQWLDMQAPLELLPLWVRAGSIVPLGPEMTHVEQKLLEPLTLELYRPLEEAETTVFDEDSPDVSARYMRGKDRLDVQVSATPGDVELVLYGTAATEAILDGQSLRVREHHGGQSVRFRCTEGAEVSFGLA